MAYSSHTYTGDGTDQQLAVNFTMGYLDRTHVHAYVEGEVTERTITWITDGLITVGSVLNGLSILIRRETPRNNLWHDFANGAILREQQIDEANMQTVMLVHEILDGYRDANFTYRSDQDLGGYRILNVGDAVDPTDAMPLGQGLAIQDAAETANTQAQAAASASASSAAASSDSASSAASSASSASASSTAAGIAKDAALAAQVLADSYADSAEAASLLTAADRLATAADVLLTAADVVQTAADKASTSADAASALASKNAAATSESNAAASAVDAAASAVSAAEVASFGGVDGASIVIFPDALISTQGLLPISTWEDSYNFPAYSYYGAEDAQYKGNYAGEVALIARSTKIGLNFRVEELNGLLVPDADYLILYEDGVEIAREYAGNSHTIELNLARHSLTIGKAITGAFYKSTSSATVLNFRPNSTALHMNTFVAK